MPLNAHLWKVIELDKQINILVSSDNNYVMPLAALMTSIVRTKNEDTKIVFYIVEDNIAKNNKEKHLLVLLVV